MESQTKLSRREKTGMVMRHLRGCWGFFTGAIALAWMNTACNALVPQIISFTVDSVLGGEAPDLPGFLRPLAPLDRLRADPLPFLWRGRWCWPRRCGACVFTACASTCPRAPRAL